MAAIIFSNSTRQRPRFFPAHNRKKSSSNKNTADDALKCSVRSINCFIRSSGGNKGSAAEDGT